MTSRHVVALAFVVSCTASTILAAPPQRTVLVEANGGFNVVDDTGPQVIGNALAAHQRNAAARFGRAAASEDVGDVAVLVDNGSMILQPSAARPVDLSNRSFTFTPAGGGFHFAPTNVSFDPTIGSALPLGDDTTIEVALPFAFSFLGTTYSSVFVNSDGNVTFGEGDVSSSNRDAGRLIGGPPRVAPLLIDLDVTTGGSINADLRSDRAVITWMAVPEFATTDANTLQLTLHATGTIDFVFGALASLFPFSGAVAGVARGNNSGPLTEIDFTTAAAATYEAGAIFEEFFPARLFKEVDVLQVAREFYRTHPDHFDMLVMFTDFQSALAGGQAFAFYLGLQNRTRGLGLGIVDFSSLAGSAGEMEGFLHMNSIDLYWPDERKLVDPPIDMFRFSGGASVLGPPGSSHISRRARRMGTSPGGGVYSLGLNSAMSVMGQESMHRWGAFVPFVHPTKGISFDSFDLLGRGFAHWSFFFNVTVPSSQFAGDPRASSMEGNAYIDFGGNVFGDCRSGQTRFRTQPNELIDGFTELDQYLMGIRRASEVGPFWYIDNPTAPGSGASFEGVRGFDAIDDIGVCGNRVNLSVANIQAFPGVGPRVPELGDEDDDGRGNDVKTQAFILLVEQGPPGAHAAAVRQVDNFRRTWQSYVNGPATGGRGKFDTSLHPVIH